MISGSTRVFIIYICEHLMSSSYFVCCPVFWLASMLSLNFPFNSSIKHWQTYPAVVQHIWVGEPVKIVDTYIWVMCANITGKSQLHLSFFLQRLMILATKILAGSKGKCISLSTMSLYWIPTVLFCLRLLRFGGLKIVSSFSESRSCALV